MTTLTLMRPVAAPTPTPLDRALLVVSRTLQDAVTRRMSRRAASAPLRLAHDEAIERRRDGAAVLHTGILPR